jgi:hypothetical protein
VSKIESYLRKKHDFAGFLASRGNGTTCSILFKRNYCRIALTFTFTSSGKERAAREPVQMFPISMNWLWSEGGVRIRAKNRCFLRIQLILQRILAAYRNT